MVVSADGQAARDLSQDRAWLAGYRAGEVAALERVFRSYAGYAFAIIRRGAGQHGQQAPGVLDPTEQDELLQEVFVRVLAPETRARYDGLRPFAPFLASIVRHVVLDHARRQRRLRARQVDADPDDDALARWSPGQPLADEALMAEQDRRLVAAFVAELGAQAQQLVALRFEQGLSQREVAVQLGLGRQVVRTLEHKIRERLRSFLAQRDGDAAAAPGAQGMGGSTT